MIPSECRDLFLTERHNIFPVQKDFSRSRLIQCGKNIEERRFPEPDSPMIATYSPSSTEKFIDFNASTWFPPNRVVYIFFKLFTSKSAISGSSPSFLLSYFSAAVSIVFTAAILFHFLKDCTQYSKTGKCMPSNQLTFPCRILHSCKIAFLFHYTFLPEIAALTNFYNRSHPFF